MSDEEWDSCSDLLAKAWPDTPSSVWDGDMSGAYCVLLGQHPFAAVMTAIERVARRGDRYRPAAGVFLEQVLSAARPQLSTPAQAIALVQEGVRRAVGRNDGDQAAKAARHQAAVDWIAERDPVVAAWAATRGLVGWGSLATERLDDPDEGHKVRDRLRWEVKEQLDQAAERIQRGLPAVSAEQLQLRDGRRKGLRRAGGGAMDELLERARPVEQHELERARAP